MHARIYPFLLSIVILSGIGTAAVWCAPPQPESGYDFIEEARFIHRIVACGEGPLPPGVDRTIVNEHCRFIKSAMERYRGDYAAKAGPFIAALKPAKLPSTVFYPFGGGDLLSAILTYPDAAEIITISLESAGDPRRLPRATAAQLKEALKESRAVLGNLFTMFDNSNTNVKALEKSMITSQLAFSLAGAAVFGYEPVSLRFFSVEKNGELRYLSSKEITSLEHTRGKRLYRWWVDTSFSEAFRNMELVLKNRKDGKRLLYRHFAANLDNSHFRGSGLEKFLQNRERFVCMTKAASYLLWMDDFSAIRDYTLSRMVFMVSDSTGILPRHAAPAGFEQITYGTFNGAFLDNRGGEKAESLRRFWLSQPHRPLPFRYGYSDDRGAFHLMITRPRR